MYRHTQDHRQHARRRVRAWLTLLLPVAWGWCACYSTTHTLAQSSTLAMGTASALMMLLPLAWLIVVRPWAEPGEGERDDVR